MRSIFIPKFGVFERCTVCAFSMFSCFVSAHDPHLDLVRAEALVREKHFSLARRYSEPAIYSSALTDQERARSYYVRAYSFYNQQLFVSARKDLNRAMEFNPSNPEALYLMGYLHYFGRGTERNMSLGFSFFNQAAALDHSGSMFYVGSAKLAGAGVERDQVSGIAMLEGLAEEGHVSSMLLLAKYYREFRPSTDTRFALQAEHLYQKALSLGSHSAALSLAFMYKNGELGARSLPRALRFFHQAARLDNAEANLYLGYANAAGEEIPLNYKAAREFYLRAAELKLAGGFLGLSYLYEFGLGVRVDKSHAKRLNDVAFSQGGAGKRASEQIVEIRNEMRE